MSQSEYCIQKFVNEATSEEGYRGVWRDAQHFKEQLRRVKNINQDAARWHNMALHGVVLFAVGGYALFQSRHPELNLPDVTNVLLTMGVPLSIGTRRDYGGVDQTTRQMYEQTQALPAQMAERIAAGHRRASQVNSDNTKANIASQRRQGSRY